MTGAGGMFDTVGDVSMDGFGLGEAARIHDAMRSDGLDTAVSAAPPLAITDGNAVTVTSDDGTGKAQGKGRKGNGKGRKGNGNGKGNTGIAAEETPKQKAEGRLSALSKASSDAGKKVHHNKKLNRDIIFLTDSFVYSMVLETLHRDSL